jgi:CubicO group peptidase (beta-lactamase class C family)
MVSSPAESFTIRAPLARRTLLKAFVLSAAAPSLRPVQAAADGRTDLAAALEPLRTTFGLPALAAAVARAGVITAAGATGVRAHGTSIPVTLTDRFHLGSDTKAMTAVLVGMSVEAGKLQWTSTIGEVLGSSLAGLNRRLAAVSIEQLLSHSGGIPSDTPEIIKLYYADAFEYNLPVLRMRMLNAWKAHAPASIPGAEFHYANLGYVIAGAMLEKAMATPWEELITRRLFEPLQLSTAGLGPQATTGKLDAPVGHAVAADGSVTPIYWGAAADLPPVLGPAGVAHMSVLDFATWGAWNAGRATRPPALIKPATLERIQRPHVSTGKIPNPPPGVPKEGQYALGWGVVKFDWAHNPVLQHNGSNSMNLAKILVDPVADLAVVVLTNFPGPKAEQACQRAMLSLYRQQLGV